MICKGKIFITGEVTSKSKVNIEKVVKKVLEGNSNLEATITPTFIVKDSDSVELFSNEVKEKGLSSYYQVTSNINEIEGATESIKNVRVFATTFLIITLIIIFIKSEFLCSRI